MRPSPSVSSRTEMRPTGSVSPTPSGFGMKPRISTTQMRPSASHCIAIGVSTIVRDGKVDMPASYEVVHKAIETFSSPAPAAAKLMVEGNFEVGGIIPLGAAFPFVNDRRINSIEAAAGKVADSVLAAFPTVRAIEVTIHKPHAPIAAITGRLRSRLLQVEHQRMTRRTR